MSGVKVSKALRIGAAGEQPVTARPDPVTGGIGFNGTIVDMDETPDDDNTENYPVGTLFISPAE